jgi:glycosyltransferase involved in cell wall biosynthesis
VFGYTQLSGMDSTFSNLEALIKEAGLTMPSLTPIESIAAPVKKRKFMLVGTHAHQMTGYSKVTYHIIQELAKDPSIELYHFAFQKFIGTPAEFRPYPKGVDVLDTVEAERNKTAEQEMGFGFSQLPAYVQKVKPDVIMIYNDAGVICRFLDKLDTLPASAKTYKMIIYLDQVYILQRPELLQRMDKAAHAYFAFTQYWRTVLQKQGITKPIHVLRHGFDPTQFKRMDKAAIRKKHGIPDQVILFLNLNRNTPRKRYDIVASAYAELVARHPTKPLLLMCVCDGGETGGFPIQEIYIRELEKHGVPPQAHLHKLLVTKQAMQFTDEIINEMYSMSDVGITAAEGEGFGLCQFEAMGVGIPQIVPNVGGFRDFCKDGVNSRAVEPARKYYLALSASPVGGMSELVDSHDLMIAAEDYVLDSELRTKHGKRARETVLAYEWKKEVEALRKVILAI